MPQNSVTTALFQIMQCQHREMEKAVIQEAQIDNKIHFRHDIYWPACGHFVHAKITKWNVVQFLCDI